MHPGTIDYSLSPHKVFTVGRLFSSQASAGSRNNGWLFSFILDIFVYNHRGKVMSDQRKYQNVIKEIPATAVDIYRMLPEGTRCEVVFNELTMSPSPSPSHQLLLSDLHAMLYVFLKNTGSGKVIPSPIDVYLEDKNSVVQPDLIVLRNENLHKINAEGIYGAPDLVIEILSRNRAYDTQKKKTLYEQAGVKEYFMIDPDNKKTTLLTLNAAGTYSQTYEEIGVFRSEILKLNTTF